MSPFVRSSSMRVSHRLFSFSVLVAVLLLSVLVATVSAAAPQVELLLEGTQDNLIYTVQVDGNVWVKSAGLFVTVNGKQYSTLDATLSLNDMQFSAGSDTVGSFNDTIFSWSTPTNDNFTTTFRQYWDLLAVPPAAGESVNPSNTRAIVFLFTWLTDVNGTQTNAFNGVTHGFPSFQGGDSTAYPLGYLSYHGMFVYSDVGIFSGANAKVSMTSGLESGPFVLFDQQASSTAVIAPFNSFMSASVEQTSSGAISWGFMGGINSIPAQTNIKVIMYFDNVGIRNTIMHYGDVMLAAYGKERGRAQDEITTKYLGFNTDNGAYYYYNTEPGKTYQQTLIDVKAYADQNSIPYQHMLLDSWWYYKHTGLPYGGGVLTWTAMPSVFPNGTQYVHEQLGMPFIAHNRFFDSETPYATANGGKYEFVFDTTYALPVDQAFWDDLFRNSTWGLRVYEQDWLVTQVENLSQLQTSLTLGRQWLMQMSKGAARHGVNIQYCMPLPRHVLQSVELPNVVQVRGSDDYQPGNDQWKLGTSSMLEFALGLAPFKDNFWTTTTQPGNTYKLSEPNPTLQTAVALLTTGPVTPSDGIPYSNASLIMMTCRADGMLLKPDVAAATLDTSFLQMAWGTNGPNGIVTHAHTTMSGFVWTIVMAAELKSSYSLGASDLRWGATALALSYWAVPFIHGALYTAKPTPFSSSQTLELSPLALPDFEMWYIAPVLPNGFTLIGEVNKLVLMSAARVTSVRWTMSTDGDASSAAPQMLVDLDGGAFEKVQIGWIEPSASTIMTAWCTLDASGSALLTVTVGSSSC